MHSVLSGIAEAPGFFTETGVREEISERFPDHAIRDSLLSAVYNLAPTGRRGIASVTFYAGGEPARPELVPENQTVPLAILLAQPDATFSRLLAPGLTVEARDPIVLVEDFNQDGTPDMAVFDAGVYATAESTGYGNPPQLLLSRPDFTHELSSALADAVAAHRHSLGTDLPGEPFTGRHVQVLINQGGMEFEDETVSWMGDQSATHIQVGLAGEPQMVKFDRDECADLVVSGSRHDFPFVYCRVGDNFKLQDRPLTTNNGYAADVNGDGAVDFVSLPGGTDVEVLLNRQ